MMRIGEYRVGVHEHGSLRLDGGAMFGSVPWTLWSKLAPPDDLNRIALATRSLVIDRGERRMVVDLGCGDKWSERLREIYAISPTTPLEGVTDVLLTHLHFDHAGGVSRVGPGGLELCYPRARHYVSGENLRNASSPNARERASYLPENVEVLAKADLTLTSDGDEVWPGLTVHRCDGHTRGLQWALLTDGETTLAFPSDVVPTASHLPVPYVMGYDMCAERAMEEKRRFLERALEGRWTVVFEHDPTLAAARLTYDGRGRAAIAEAVDLKT